MNRSKLQKLVPVGALTFTLVASSLSAFADGRAFHARPATTLALVSANPQFLPTTTYLVYANAAVALVANSPKAYAVTVAAVEYIASAAAEASSSSSSSGGVAADPASTAPKADEFD
jgi:hypothetical protein